MNTKIFNPVLTILSGLIMIGVMVNISMSAQTVNIDEVQINDPNLIREIVFNINSDSIRNEIKKNFFPYAKLKNKKYISIGLKKYPLYYDPNLKPEIIEELLPEGVCIDSCKLMVTITYCDNLLSRTFTKHRNDTLWVETFPFNEEMNKIYLTYKARRTYSYETTFLSRFIITQFLYINGKLYLNPNKTDWYSVYI